MATKPRARARRPSQRKSASRLINESNERQTADKSFKVLSYVPETKDFTFLDGGWAETTSTLLPVCRLAGWRGEAGSWHCADGVEEAPGRQLEMLAIGMEPGTPAKKAGGL